MSEKYLYKKVGRRYVPVSTSELMEMNYRPFGATLVISQPGCTSYHHKVDPALAPLIAAGVYAKEAITNAMANHNEFKPDEPRELTKEQQDAYQRLREAFGGRHTVFRGVSINDVAQAGIDAMIEEATKLMTHPAVKDAYDQFMSMIKLTQEQQQQ